MPGEGVGLSLAGHIRHLIISIRGKENGKGLGRKESRNTVGYGELDPLRIGYYRKSAVLALRASDYRKKPGKKQLPGSKMHPGRRTTNINKRVSSWGKNNPSLTSTRGHVHLASHKQKKGKKYKKQNNSNNSLLRAVEKPTDRPSPRRRQGRGIRTFRLVLSPRRLRPEW